MRTIEKSLKNAIWMKNIIMTKSKLKSAVKTLLIADRSRFHAGEKKISAAK